MRLLSIGAFPFALIGVLVVAMAVKVPPLAGALLWCTVVVLVHLHHSAES